MDILILNTYPSRSSLFRDNGTGNTLVHKRRGEGCRSCVIGSRINSHVSRMFLAFCSRFARVLLPFEGIKKHVARPLSPSIARKRKMCLKKEVKWRDLSLKVPTRGF